ncbi:MAG TPA: M48 family peptidase [Candidatus Vogelbacteria bacterium]|nr:M48 family peptidase [Candidatus Vogelbacteria bacterium]
MSYRIKKIAHPRFKCLRLSVSQDGQVLLTYPKFLSKRAIDNFLINKESWIKEKLKNTKMPTDDYLLYKEKARQILKEKVEYYNSLYGFLYNKIYIRRGKSRWGSCSSKKNLNFNYRLIFLPEKFLDYVVIHELCHLREMNHGPAFWALVAKTRPDYLEIKKKMKSFCFE